MILHSIHVPQSDVYEQINHESLSSRHCQNSRRMSRGRNVPELTLRVRTTAELHLFGPKENVHVRSALGEQKKERICVSRSE
jgi:hypothetical protein